MNCEVSATPLTCDQGKKFCTFLSHYTLKILAPQNQHNYFFYFPTKCEKAYFSQYNFSKLFILNCLFSYIQELFTYENCAICGSSKCKMMSVIFVSWRCCPEIFVRTHFYIKEILGKTCGIPTCFK